jgi:hypothetical protein
MVLLLIGIVGLYAGQAEVAGLLGLAGFLVIFVGTTLRSGLRWFNAFALPSAAEAVPDRSMPTTPVRCCSDWN